MTLNEVPRSETCTCRSASLSEAGRTLFAASRTQRTSTNDSDRLRKYLAKFGLDWASLDERRDWPQSNQKL